MSRKPTLGEVLQAVRTMHNSPEMELLLGAMFLIARVRDSDEFREVSAGLSSLQSSQEIDRRAIPETEDEEIRVAARIAGLLLSLPGVLRIIANCDDYEAMRSWLLSTEALREAVIQGILLPSAPEAN